MDKTFTKLSLFLLVGLFTLLPGQVADRPASGKFAPRVQSLVIPGWGEKTLQRPARARFFIGSEISLWVSFAGSFLYTDLLQDRMVAYAAEHAGVEGSGKETQFWIDIGNYDSRDAYNEEHLRWRDYESLYPTGTTWYWDWDTDQHRSRFETLRIRRDQWSLAGKFLLGGLLLNRVVSIIDVLYLQRIEHIKSVSVFPSYNPSFATLKMTLSVAL
jgi:hypothetical protein